MSNERLHWFRSRLDAVLDRREDPLADGELVAFLEEHPELLEQFATERALLAGLSAATVTPHTTRRLQQPRSIAIAAAAVAAAAATVLWWLPTAADAPTDTGPRILAATLSERPRSLPASVRFHVREPLLRTRSTTLEIYDNRTERR